MRYHFVVVSLVAVDSKIVEVLQGLRKGWLTPKVVGHFLVDRCLVFLFCF